MRELTLNEIDAVSGAISLSESISGGVLGAIGDSWVGANAGGWIVGGISAGVDML
ncbi:hypothetical protein L5B88_20015 [Pseudomonas aeruginosa]|nr:hypothetical protein [Pseudomonas aeruginosa]